MQTWLIYNPVSGGKSKEKIVENIRHQLPYFFDLQILKTEYRGHASILAREAVKKNIHLIIAIGGDGTFHEIGTSILNSDTSMAMIPMGSGNGFARYFSNNINTQLWIRKIPTGKPVRVDTVQWNDGSFINAAGLGFDAKVAHQFSNSNIRGFKKYIIEVIKALLKLQTTTVDEQGNILMVSIMNGSQFGNNFILDVKANLKDGRISKVIVQKGSLFKMLQFAVLAFHGKAHYSKLVFIEYGSEFDFKSESKFAHFDGEPKDLEIKKHHVKVMPSSLKIWL